MFIESLEIKDEAIVKVLSGKLLAYKQNIYINDNLTEEEIAGIRQLCEENEMLSKFFFEVCAQMIEYKKSGALDNIEKPEVTDEELRGIMMFIESLEIKDEAIVKVLSGKLLAYKQNIYINDNLTEEEIAGIRKLCEENECLSKFFYEVCAQMIEYKKSGALEKIEKPEVTDEELRGIMMFIESLEIKDEMIVKTLTSKLLAYKQAIYDAMNPSSEYKLTDEEIRGIETLTKEMKELFGLEEKLKEAMLEYKKSGALDDLKDPMVTDEEKRAIMETLLNMGVDKGAVEELTDKLAKKLEAYKEQLVIANKK